MTQPAVSNNSLTRAPSRAARAGFVLVPGDVEILRLVAEHRFLRREQLSVLVARHAKRLHRRLIKLEEHHHLKSIRLPQAKFIYGIGRRGVEVLVEQGIAPVERLQERLRTHELKDLFLKHEMMIVDVHVSLTRASASGQVKLIGWREGRELYDSVVAVDSRGSSRLPVRPDAFFTLEDLQRPEGARRASYALEADRSTTSHARFQEKIRAYWAYIEQGLHEKKYSVKGFRVLTVTLSDARARNLAGLAASLLPTRAQKYFLFTSIQKFEAGDPIREAICYAPRPQESSDLLPLVARSNELHI